MSAALAMSPLDLAELTALKVIASSVRVMLVDDDAQVRRVLSNALSHEGYHVITADDVEPALALAASAPPDLVIVDYNMPTKGTHLVRELRARHGAAVWIAVLSGDTDDDTRSACFRAGADDVLPKPLSFAELKRRLLSASRAQQAYVESRLALERADRRATYGAEAAAMPAHDLNNGLAVALSNLSYLRAFGMPDRDSGEALDHTLGALRRMSGLVANFVDIARFEDAAVKPRVTKVEVARLFDEVVGIHRASMRVVSYEKLDCDPELVAVFDATLVELRPPQPWSATRSGTAGRAARSAWPRARRIPPSPPRSS